MIRAERGDLSGLWRRLGIEPGMIVLCHSFIGALGRIAGGPRIVVETLLEAVGSWGGLIAPAFTYSYFKNDVYDPDQTPSTVGVLGDIVRKFPGSQRNLDPNFSNAAIGDSAQRVITFDDPASFGAASPYARLLAADCRILLLGVDYTALPLFMHLEFVNGVPYRHPKAFAGRSRVGGELRDTVAIHHVRDADLDPQTDRRRIGVFIDREPDLLTVDLPYGVARAMPARTVARVVERELARDPLILLAADRPFLGSKPS